MRAPLLLAALLAVAASSPAQDLTEAQVLAKSDAKFIQTMLPDSAQASPGDPGKLTVRVLVHQGAQWLAVPNLAFRATYPSGQAMAVTDASGQAALDGCQDSEGVLAQATLTDDSFSIRPLLASRLVAQGHCGEAVELNFEPSNPSAAALRVWRVTTLAKAKLASNVGASAWPKGLGIHIAEAATNGVQVGVGPEDTTFVIGHELGHAISAGNGMIQEGFGSSFHQMTGCIGDSAALEEGWASFFGAWVDQGFETAEPMQEWTPRQRLSIKTVPDSIPLGDQTAKVCVGTDNEMRVMSFLWNVAAPDGLDVPIAVLWKTLAGKHLASISQVARGLQRLGVDPARLEPVWTAAFKTSYPR